MGAERGETGGPGKPCWPGLKKGSGRQTDGGILWDGPPGSQTRTGLQWKLELHGEHRTSRHVCSPEAGRRPQRTGNPKRSHVAKRVGEERALHTEGEGRRGPTAGWRPGSHRRGAPGRGLSAGSTSGLREQAGPRQKRTFSAGLQPEAETHTQLPGHRSVSYQKIAEPHENKAKN